MNELQIFNSEEFGDIRTVTSNANRYPKKFRFSLVDKMQNKSMEIYEMLFEANRTDIKA